MRTEPADAMAAGREMLRRIGRAMGAMGPLGRLALVGGALTAIVAVGYLAGGTEAEAERAWICGGHLFSKADAERIVGELEGQKIAARAVDGRVEVRRERLADAHAWLEKKNLKPASISDLIDPATARSAFFDPPHAREQSELRRREQVLEQVIRKVDRRLNPTVKLHRPTRRGLAPAAPLQATVYLEIDEARPLAPKLIDRIKVLVESFEPELAEHNGLYLCDSEGRAYLNPAEPDLNEQVSLHARADFYRTEIEQQLDLIKGARIGVNVEPAAEPAAAQAQALDPPPLPATAAPEVSVNRPPDPEPDPVIMSPTSSGGARPPAEKVRVVVWVPNTYYLEQARALFGDRAPSSSDLGALVARTREMISTAVSLIVPADALCDLTIEQYFAAEETAAPAPKRLEPVAPGLPDWLAPALGGAVAGGVALLLGTGWWWSGRRQPRSGVAVRRPHIELTGNAPAERVRELVRLDPAAAAGVLQRWLAAGDSQS